MDGLGRIMRKLCRRCLNKRTRFVALGYTDCRTLPLLPSPLSADALPRKDVRLYRRFVLRSESNSEFGTREQTNGSVNCEQFTVLLRHIRRDIFFLARDHWFL